MTSPTVTQEVMLATAADITRLESSVKELTTAVQQVILLGERQTQQGIRLGNIETEIGKLNTKIDTEIKSLTDKHDKLDRKVADWISRGVGAWFVLVFAVGAIKYFIR